MTSTPNTTSSSGLAFLAAALLYFSVMLYLGSTQGAGIVVFLFSPILLTLAMMELNLWLSGNWKKTWAERLQDMRRSDPDPDLQAATRNGYWFIGFCEFFWVATIALPDPVTWVPSDTTVTDWLLAHASAAAVGIAVYRSMPGKFQSFLTVGAFSFVVASLGIAHEFPDFIARYGN